jgi:glucose-1-phosphate thymidylyltransferase
MDPPVGIVPAAGRGSRLWPYRLAKELIPVGYHSVRPDNGSTRLIPKAVIDYTMGALRLAGAEAAFIVLSPTKWEILRYLMHGDHLAMDIAYLCQEHPNGMPPAVDLAWRFVRDRTVCMGLPDTLVEPADCFAQLLAFHDRRGADLSLGVFAVDDPRSLAPVVLEPATGRVLDIVDKPEQPPAANAWGIAVWSPAFTDFLHEWVASRPIGPETGEQLMSEVFLQATVVGLRVYGLQFEASSFLDIGAPTDLLRARRRFESLDVADPRAVYQAPEFAVE